MEIKLNVGYQQVCEQRRPRSEFSLEEMSSETAAFEIYLFSCKGTVKQPSRLRSKIRK